MLPVSRVCVKLPPKSLQPGTCSSLRPMASNVLLLWALEHQSGQAQACGGLSGRQQPAQQKKIGRGPSSTSQPCRPVLKDSAGGNDLAIISCQEKEWHSGSAHLPRGLYR